VSILPSITRPGVWAWAAGGWLILAGLTQGGLHLWQIVGEHGMVGLLEFAMNAMKQAFLREPLEPSLWRRHRMLSASLAFFFVGTGAVPCLLAGLGAPHRVLAGTALFQTTFWTSVFMFYAFSDPVLLPLVTSAVAAALHGTLWLAATITEREENTRRTEADAPG